MAKKVVKKTVKVTKKAKPTKTSSAVAATKSRVKLFLKLDPVYVAYGIFSSAGIIWVLYRIMSIGLDSMEVGGSTPDEFLFLISLVCVIGIAYIVSLLYRPALVRKIGLLAAASMCIVSAGVITDMIEVVDVTKSLYAALFTLNLIFFVYTLLRPAGKYTK